MIFRTLAQHCHNIERLDLSDCKRITDQAIYAISKHCSKLTGINLESCVNITDKTLKNVADGCPVRYFHQNGFFFSSIFSPITFPFFSPALLVNKPLIELASVLVEKNLFFSSKFSHECNLSHNICIFPLFTSSFHFVNRIYWK